VPKGKWTVEYTLRMNQDGAFDLRATRVEAMYAPEMFGEIPNLRMVVMPQRAACPGNYSCAAANGSQAFRSPVSSPRRNQRTRCCALP
jgi:Bacterial Alpha-2-macroglobulin MG10 domain